MARRFAPGAALVVALALVPALSACTSPDAPESPTPTTSTARSTDSASSPPDTMDPSGAEDASAVARSAMEAFVQNKLPYDEWWAGLSPYLDGDALVAYEYTDPALVPASSVTGDPQVSAAPDATQITVLVPTDVGQYQVLLNRQAVGGEWTVSRMTPPEGLS
jgi:hypothetical protein